MEHLEGARVVAIDRIAHRVILSDGTALGYKKLALCTGGRPRPLVCKGMDPAQPRVLARVAGPEVSQFYEDVHLDPGVNLITGTIVARMGCEGGRIVAVLRSTDRRLSADMVVAGIGMLANIELARNAALDVDGGIPVAARCVLNLYPMRWSRRALPHPGCAASPTCRCPGSGSTSTRSSCRWLACRRVSTVVCCAEAWRRGAFARSTCRETV